MPYVLDEVKQYLDPTPHTAPPQNTGELTFQITCLLRRYLERAGTIRYTHLSDCLGALEGARVDLIDRVVVPYEHKKRAENGDVWPETILEQLRT